MQQAEALGFHLLGEQRHAGDVTPWLVEVGDEALLDRIAARDHDDRNLRGYSFCGQRRRFAAHGGDHRHLASHEICCHGRQSIVLSVSPTIFDLNVAVFHVAGPAQCFAKDRKIGYRSPRGYAAQPTDHRYRLLRARRERPSRRSPAQNREKLPSSHAHPVRGDTS
jgi:hypothetical protein